MDQRIWTKTEDKAAHILLKRGPVLHQLKVTGNALTLKGNIRKVLEGLEAGAEPNATKAKLVETLDAREIGKAELSPGGGSLTLYGPGETPKKIKFRPGDGAGPILDEILAESGRSFEPTEEEIGVGETLLAPLIVGVIGGLIWALVYGAANDLTAGREVEVKGRRRGQKQLIVWVAGLLGPKVALALGVAFFLMIAFWAYQQITQRPKRTVLRPASA